MFHSSYIWHLVRNNLHTSVKFWNFFGLFNHRILHAYFNLKINTLLTVSAVTHYFRTSYSKQVFCLNNVSEFFIDNFAFKNNKVNRYIMHNF